MWQIFASYPLGDGYWTRHTVSDPSSGECFDLIERHKIAAGLPVFVCLEESCESDWCQHIRDGATLVTMSRAGEGEGCRTTFAGADILCQTTANLAACASNGRTSGTALGASTSAPATSSSRRSAKRTASPQSKPKNPRKFKKDRIKLFAAAWENRPEIIKEREADLQAFLEMIASEE